MRINAPLSNVLVLSVRVYLALRHADQPLDWLSPDPIRHLGASDTALESSSVAAAPRHAVGSAFVNSTPFRGSDEVGTACRMSQMPMLR